MKIKLCRIFNVFNKATIIYSSILLFATLIFGFMYNNFWYVILVPIFSVFYCLNYSKFLKVENQTITYKDFEIIPNLGRGKEFKYINNEVTIKVDEIKFYQNIFEKVFNVGHIEFLEVGADKHTVYGITHFNARKQEIANNLK